MGHGSDLRIAVDIGGTFTDLVLEDGGRVVHTEKVLTTPDDPSRGVIEGITPLLGDRSPQDVVEVIHGTTLVSNSLIERKGAITALVTTAGFRDVLSMGREQRFDLYDLFLDMPEPLVPRRRRWGVKERVLADGTVRQPLDLADVRRVCREMTQAEVESVAVCLLHSYVSYDHERLIAEIIEETLPGIPVSLSSEVSPEIGEFDRMSTTAANAYVRPVVDAYLDTLEKSLVEIGIDGALRIMLSNGGLASVGTARRFPVRLLESGPAAGVLSAAFQARRDGMENLLAFDMGGTTAKAALVESGRPMLSAQHEAARTYRFKRGSGLPIRVPVIDLIEIGAGGGSIARVGTFGLPNVGPDSSSSVPGPAAYGLGGTDATVTDADLVLGYLNPDNFLGGAMPLHVDRARGALAALGEPMGMSAEEAAVAVHRVVNENMANAAQMHAVERGRDLRALTLVATGGAGPVHAWGVARSLGIRRLVFPPRAGVASAFGMITAPPSFEFARSLPSQLSETDWDAVGHVLDELGAEGETSLKATNSPVTDLELRVEVRFRGQGAALTVDLGAGLPENPASSIQSSFEAAYRRIYGALPVDVEVDILTWRMRVSGPVPSPDPNVEMLATPSTEQGRRRMWLESEGFVEGEVARRSEISPGGVLEGPVVIEEDESTIVVGIEGRAEMTTAGNIVVTIHG